MPGTGTGNIIAYSGHSGIAIGNDAAGDLILGNAIIDNATNPGIPETGVSLSGDIDAQVGGTGAGDGNLISGNNGDGIGVADSTNTLIQGNLIGTNAAGTAAFANSYDGVLIETGSTGTTVGGTAAGAGNVISGNTEYGVEINGTGTSSNLVAGNLIGTNAAGTAAIPDDFGVVIDSGASGNTIGGSTLRGAGNVLSGNTLDGIYLEGSAAGDNLLAGNVIGTNAAGTAALANKNDGIIIESTGNTIGGTSAGYGNLISGNTGYGLVFSLATASGNLVEGNLVGTDAAGTGSLGNGIGVGIVSASNTIGGTATGAGNVISGNPNDGILIESGAATGNLVEGNFIGTNTVGGAAIANGDGVMIESGASNNSIGGLTATPGTGAGNLISGDTGDGVEITDSGSTGNVIAGNLIGTDVTGTVAVANAADGVEIANDASGNTVGGTSAPARNVISGSDFAGVEIDSLASDNVVEGDYIGTDVTGDAALGNPVGVLISSTGNTVGGTASGAGNVIVGNDGTTNAYDGYQVAITALHGADQPTQNVIEGNLIGLDASGQATAGATNGGVLLGSDDGSPTDNTVGGSTPAARNVISGNLGNGVEMEGVGDVVEGNYIGTDTTGTIAIGNGFAGDGINIINGSHNTVGGRAAGTGNVIGGNQGPGILANGSNAAYNLIEGNFVGTDATGTINLSNEFGIELNRSGFANTIGGATAAPGTGAGNLIEFNTGFGIDIELASGADVILGNAITGNGDGPSLDPGIRLILNTEAIYIGESSAEDRNVISGNYGGGIALISNNGADVEGNYIGTNAAGTAAFANAGDGVTISDGADNTIGGVGNGAGNVISGNTEDGVEISGVGSGIAGNLVVGNLIGTNATGSAAIANGKEGVEIDSGATDNTIGGLTAMPGTGAGNLISGNTGDGVEIDGSGMIGNVVAGNLIGTDVTGTVALANGGDGVLISGAPSNTIGGATASSRNVISGNTGDGVEIDGTGTTDNVVAGNLIGTDVTGTVALRQPHRRRGDRRRCLGQHDRRLGLLADILCQPDLGQCLRGRPDRGLGHREQRRRRRLDRDHQQRGFLVARWDIDEELQRLWGRHRRRGRHRRGASGDRIGTDGAAGDSGERNIISGNDNDGVDLFGTGSNVVAGNWIGLGQDGAGLGNAGDGVLIVAGPAGNTIGGTTVGSGNVISGNADGVQLIDGAAGNLLEGNRMGTDAAGTAAIPNQDAVLVGASDNTIGGTASGAGNLLSGNNFEGIYIFAGVESILIQGNYIGINVTGTAALADGQEGIDDHGLNNTIGGTAIGAGNVISGNADEGIYQAPGSATTLIQGNLIGTNAAGTIAIPNGDQGISEFSDSDTIGGTAAGRATSSRAIRMMASISTRAASRSWSRATTSARMPPGPPPWATASMGSLSTRPPIPSAAPRPAPATSSRATPKTVSRSAAWGHPAMRSPATSSAPMPPAPPRSPTGPTASRSTPAPRATRSAATTPGTGAGNLISGNTDIGVEITGSGDDRQPGRRQLHRHRRHRHGRAGQRRRRRGDRHQCLGQHHRRHHGRRPQHHLRQPRIRRGDQRRERQPRRGQLHRHRRDRDGRAGQQLPGGRIRRWCLTR